MKNNFKQTVLKLTLVFAFVLGIAGLGVNAYAASAPAAATATVVVPITITKVNDLRFGSFSTSAAAQTIVLGTAGTRTPTGLLLLGTAQNVFGAASFTVGGQGTLTYAITKSGPVNITTGLGGATETMAVSAFTSSPDATGTLAAGSQTLLVGATLTTVASQVAGAYTGTFSTTVEYN
ncbi:MAG: DUF4402 domain-containing protein [Kiritimatiellae bacterium]|nr:DUF4402 domain-containing protein [Kiritimatiellia bacterium]